MDTDLVLTVGIVVLVLSLPALLSAWAESRLSRLGVIMVALGAGMTGWATYATPEGYRLEEIPTVILEVIARYLG